MVTKDDWRSLFSHHSTYWLEQKEQELRSKVLDAVGDVSERDRAEARAVLEVMAEIHEQRGYLPGRFLKRRDEDQL